MLGINKDNIKTVMVIAGIAMIFILIYIVYTSGVGSLAILFQRLFKWALILAAVGLVVYGVIWIFQTKRIDLVATHRDNLIEACLLSQTPYKQTLMMAPKGDDWAMRTIGTILGVAMIKATPKKSIETKGSKKEKKIVEKKYTDLIFVAFRPQGFLNAVFRRKKICGGTREDFSTLTGDVVYLRGMTFGPEIYGILFLAHHWEQRHLIDETIKENVYRYALEENLKELATMMQDAIDASPKHKKEQERSNIQYVPVIGDKLGPKT